MGIFLGKIQALVIENSMFYSFVYGFAFNTASSWKLHFEGARARLLASPEAKTATITATNTSSLALYDMIERYGLWPLRNIFACDLSSYDCCGLCNGSRRDAYALKTDKEKIEYEIERLRWAHRRFFWFYLVQSILLGTPLTMAYSVDSNKSVRSGAIVYYALQILLLIVFYFWNRYEHSKMLDPSLTTKYNYTPDTVDDVKDSVWSRFNATYLCWFLTVTLFSAAVVFKASVNVSLIVVYVWTFALMLWSVVCSSYKTVDYFFSTLKSAFLKER
jgi:hypothetical protein